MEVGIYDNSPWKFLITEEKDHSFNLVSKKKESSDGLSAVKMCRYRGKYLKIIYMDGLAEWT